MMYLRERIVLDALELLGVPYIWGGDDPDGLDCSGFIGYLLRKRNILPPGFDLWAQAYHNRWREFKVEGFLPATLAFYGKNPKKVVHVMLVVAPDICIGAVRGNKYIDTPERAASRKARVDWRRINYRDDLITICDPIEGEVSNGQQV